MNTVNIAAHSKSVILLSGGLDSATCLAYARSLGAECYTLSFDYGQKHRAELEAAHQISRRLGAKRHEVVSISMGQLGGSALTDSGITVPENEAAASASDTIPITYVPARNTVFLAIALGWAEILEADSIVIGVSAIDYAGYPDCRPEYIQAFQQMATLATRCGVSGKPIQIITPLIQLSKAQTIQWGVKLGIDYSQTVSCYQADAQGKACGVCNSCYLRKQGFVAAGVEDPTRYN